MSVARMEAIVKGHMKAYDPSHDWAHVERVRRVALKLAPPGANLLVVELAALMHDLNDYKYATSTPLAQIAADNLGPDVTEEEVAQVLRIVPSVSYSKEMELRAAGEWTWQKACKELHAVQDADRLDAVGAVGVLRCAAFTGVRGKPLLNVPLLNGEEPGDTAEEHFHYKLLKIKDYMKTDKGRQEAEARHQVMTAYLAALARERAWATEP